MSLEKLRSDGGSVILNLESFHYLLFDVFREGSRWTGVATTVFGHGSEVYDTEESFRSTSSDRDTCVDSLEQWLEGFKTGFKCPKPALVRVFEGVLSDGIEAGEYQC